MIGMVYSKKAHRTIHIEDQYPQLDAQTRQRQHNAMIMAEKRAAKEDTRWRAHGICPKCHCYLPLSKNHCPDCD